jgi:hypothetical protein
MASRALEVACVDVSGGSKLDAPEDVLLDVLDFGARPTCWCGDADGPGRPMACVDAAGGSELDVEVLVGP